MPSKKRFFKRTKKTIGDNSGKPREKKVMKKNISVQIPKPSDAPERKKPYSPNINRSITERFGFLQDIGTNLIFLKKAAVVVFIAMFLAFFTLGMVLLWQKGATLTALIMKRQELMQNMQLWENIAQKYPTYRDAYFQAAVLAYELGNDGKEKMYLEKTLVLDPNYEPAKKLQSLQ